MVGFVITGEFITEHARDLLLEDSDWQAGHRFLMESIDGLDDSQAITILKGEKRLVGQAGRGVNTLDLVSEDSAVQAEIEQECQFRWAGVIRDRPGYRRPYAYVFGYDSADLGAARRVRSARVCRPVG